MTNIAACEHPDQPHTVWYWVNDPWDPIPVPYSLKLDNRHDAMVKAFSFISKGSASIRWVKVFRSDNESYTCFKWVNPTPAPVQIVRHHQDRKDRFDFMELLYKAMPYLIGVFLVSYILMIAYIYIWSQ